MQIYRIYPHLMEKDITKTLLNDHGERGCAAWVIWLYLIYEA